MRYKTSPDILNLFLLTLIHTVGFPFQVDDSPIVTGGVKEDTIINEEVKRSVDAAKRSEERTAQVRLKTA